MSFYHAPILREEWPFGEPPVPIEGPALSEDLMKK
jgi:hypothetical protein